MNPPAEPTVSGLLESSAPSNAFDMLVDLLTALRARDVRRLTTAPPPPKRSWAGRLAAKLRRLFGLGAVVAEERLVIDREILSQDFVLYVLRERPELPLRYFPEADHRLLRRFVRDKLLLGAVRVFDRNLLLDDGYDTLVDHYSQAASRHLNLAHGKYFDSFGFITCRPLPESIDLGSLIAHYALENIERSAGDGAVLDVGPYVGDSTYILAQHFSSARILCFEPDAANRDQLIQNLRLNNLNRVEVIPKGAGLAPAILPVIQPGSAGAGVQESAVSQHSIEVDTLDHMLAEAGVEKVGVIKLDIEGQEKNALLGARAAITRDRPLLLIAAYHRGEDIFCLPALLREMVPAYEFCFRHLDPRAHAGEYIIIAYVPQSDGGRLLRLRHYRRVDASKAPDFLPTRQLARSARADCVA
jgi:FkbM family methyltransferase